VRHHLPSSLLIAVLLAEAALGQSSLRLKTHTIVTDPNQTVFEVEGTGPSGEGHLLLQFGRQPDAEHVNELTGRGVTVLADIPENGLLVSVPGPVVLTGLGVQYAAAIAPADKISPLDASNTTDHLLVEFYPDVDLNYARELVGSTGAWIVENPSLGPHVLMIQTSDMTLIGTLAQLDDVSYIFPASNDLVQGLPVDPCVGALTTNGATVQSIPTYGDGWDGPGLGAATVAYYYTNVTAQLNAAAAKAEIARAMSKWAAVVEVTWVPGSSPTAPRTVNIMWATYAHGDGNPFDGPGGVLAHTYYPAPPNPEPIAGDMHFDDSESWHIGSTTDLFSVSLHELGHALGLGHSDNPNDVMYPYYKMVTGLAPGDIAAIQTLYAAAGTSSTVTNPSPTTPTPAPTVAALTLTVNAVSTTTTSASVTLSGSAQGGSGAITVSWTLGSLSGNAIGTAAAWTISNIPLTVGANTIAITATAGASKVIQTVTVTRQSTTTPTTPTTPTNPGTTVDTTPPTLTIASPGATSISTSASTIAFSGTASDNVGVTKITWSTNTGQSGTATGTISWTCTIPLLTGSNVVTIMAYDAAGNSSWRSVVVSKS